MSARGLELSPEKTVITHIEDGFDFLGHHVQRHGTKTLITPARKNVAALLDKVRAILKDHQQASAGDVIWRLNPLIRGWALYHRHQASKATFSRVDHIIFTWLWRWAKRRHPHKPAEWIRKKYFRTQQGRQWVFFGQTTHTTQEPYAVWLFAAMSVPITRHIKVRAEANPYDPAWEVYFEERLGVKLAQTFTGRRRLLHLWQRAERAVPRLPPEDHHADRVAQPPYRVAVPGGQRRRSESSAPASHLPQPSASPRAHRRETASGNGRWKGLSCLTGNCPEQFLGGGMAATPSCYPAPTSRWRGAGATSIGRSTLMATWWRPC